MVGSVIAAALAILALGAAIAHAQDGQVIPDPSLTPGVIATTNQAEVCGFVGGLSYSQRHRTTTSEMKAEVRRRYGMARCGEIDHRGPLALGFADVVENLWCQPGPPETWNFKLKDRLETYVWEAVCRHHTMTLDQGQRIFLEPDWRRPYCELIGGDPCLP